jgi:hypothetical protein
MIVRVGETYGEKVKHGKELVGRVVILEHITGCATRDQSHEGDKNRNSQHDCLV